MTKINTVIETVAFASTAKFMRTSKGKIKCSCCSKLSKFSFKNDDSRIVDLCGTHTLQAMTEMLTDTEAEFQNENSDI